MISRDCIIEPLEPIPPGSRFKAHSDFTVQDMVITPANTRYRLARWQTPDGCTLKGELPAELHGGHFGPTLVSYVLYQHHHCQVTQPLLHEQLNECKGDWCAHLQALDIITPKHQKIATEGALQGALEGLHVATNPAIVSDDACQFNVLTHGLCWVHAERLVHKMVPLNEYHRVDLGKR